MKKTLYILAILLGMSTATQAQNKKTVVDGVSVSDFKMERNGAYMAVDMALGLEDLDVDGNRAVLLTPRLVNGSDSLDLPSIGIYGRRRYYFYVRNGESMLSSKDEKSFKASEMPDNIAYHHIVSYTDWMNGVTSSQRLRLLQHAAG